MSEKECNKNKDIPTNYTLRTKQVPDISRVSTSTVNNNQPKDQRSDSNK